MDQALLRAQFPVVAETVFFNHSAVSPLPVRACLAGQAVFEERCRRASADYFRWMAAVAETRVLAARLLGARPEEVAFTGNTSHGLGLVAAGLDFVPGDRVAVTWPDFPTLRFPFDNLAGRGVTVVEIPKYDGRVDMDAARRIIPGCRLVVASTVDWTTGVAAPVEELAALCRESGALLCLDAIQSLGALPMDAAALGVDFLAAGCHKWQLGPMGLGIFYVAPRAAALLSTPLAGWRSMRRAEELRPEFALKEDAGRFEPGTQDIAGICAYGASLSLFMELGPEEVRARIFAVTDLLAGELASRGLGVASPLSGPERSGILAFDHPDAPGLFKYFMDHGVAVSLRAGRIRLSPHCYNDASDAQRFLAALDAFDGRC
ncbi:aminotransferase class V-fold PLP-dependent enzyme [Solidesulfovibrio sp.]|uniref:aminotransferase class V-fold PLP-dependent enzyme n=1 Tax=Solidesulfovibrio sp. TaxID=2910990 RepID=UPI0026078263|nr:aminotransferase class V-fold PLP-dependent enzyme [Solidesulfovibrio sp.]